MKKNKIEYDFDYECDYDENNIDNDEPDYEEADIKTDGFYLENYLNNVNEHRELADIETQKKMIELACSDDLFIAKEYRKQCCEQFHFYIIKVLCSHWSDYMKMASVREELIAEAQAAMLEALPKYNPSLGSPTNFLTSHIKHAATEYISKMYHHSTPYEARNWKKVNQSIEKLKREYGCMPSDLDVHYDTGLSLGVIRKSLVKRQFVSFDECNDVADDYNKSPEEVVIQQQFRHQILEVLRQVLSDDEFIYVKYRYGFTELGAINKSEIRKKMNWSASTVNRIHESVTKIFKNTKLFQSLSNTSFSPKRWNIFDDGGSNNIAVAASDALIEDVIFTDSDLF